MKLAIISDTHGEIDTVVSSIKQIEGIDLLIHLGDYVKDADKIAFKLGIDMINVKGNCDMGEDKVREEELIQVKGKKLLLTHGHLYGVKSTLNHIYYRAMELGAHMALFGHSHVQTLERYNGVIFLNPGSPSLPRGGAKGTFVVVEIKEEIEVVLVYV